MRQPRKAGEMSPPSLGRSTVEPAGELCPHTYRNAENEAGSAKTLKLSLHAAVSLDGRTTGLAVAPEMPDSAVALLGKEASLVGPRHSP